MRTQHVLLLACPKCQANLELLQVLEERGEKIKEGTLTIMAFLRKPERNHLGH